MATKAVESVSLRLTIESKERSTLPVVSPKGTSMFFYDTVIGYFDGPAPECDCGECEKEWIRLIAPGGINSSKGGIIEVRFTKVRKITLGTILDAMRADPKIKLMQKDMTIWADGIITECNPVRSWFGVEQEKRGIPRISQIAAFWHKGRLISGRIIEMTNEEAWIETMDGKTVTVPVGKIVYLNKDDDVKAGKKHGVILSTDYGNLTARVKLQGDEEALPFSEIVCYELLYAKGSYCTFIGRRVYVNGMIGTGIEMIDYEEMTGFVHFGEHDAKTVELRLITFIDNFKPGDRVFFNGNPEKVKQIDGDAAVTEGKEGKRFRPLKEIRRFEKGEHVVFYGNSSRGIVLPDRFGLSHRKGVVRVGSEMVVRGKATGKMIELEVPASKIERVPFGVNGNVVANGRHAVVREIDMEKRTAVVRYDDFKKDVPLAEIKKVTREHNCC